MGVHVLSRTRQSIYCVSRLWLGWKGFLQLCLLSLLKTDTAPSALGAFLFLLTGQSSVHNTEYLERHSALSILKSFIALTIICELETYFGLWAFRTGILNCQLWQLPRDGKTYGNLWGVRHRRGPTQRSEENDLWRNKHYCCLLCMTHLVFAYHGMLIFCWILQI